MSMMLLRVVGHIDKVRAHFKTYTYQYNHVNGIQHSTHCVVHVVHAPRFGLGCSRLWVLQTNYDRPGNDDGTVCVLLHNVTTAVPHTSVSSFLSKAAVPAVHYHHLCSTALNSLSMSVVCFLYVACRPCQAWVVSPASHWPAINRNNQWGAISWWQCPIKYHQLPTRFMLLWQLPGRYQNSRQLHSDGATGPTLLTIR